VWQGAVKEVFAEQGITRDEVQTGVLYFGVLVEKAVDECWILVSDAQDVELAGVFVDFCGQQLHFFDAGHTPGGPEADDQGAVGVEVFGGGFRGMGFDQVVDCDCGEGVADVELLRYRASPNEQ